MVETSYSFNLLGLAIYLLKILPLLCGPMLLIGYRRKKRNRENGV